MKPFDRMPHCSTMLALAFAGAALAPAARADEFTDLTARQITLIPLGGYDYDVDVEIGFVPGSLPSTQPVVVRLYFDGQALDERLVFGPPFGGEQCCSDWVDCDSPHPGETGACTGQCSSTPIPIEHCVYTRHSRFGSKHLPPPPVILPGGPPHNRLTAVVDPDGWHTQTSDPNRTNDTSYASVAWDQACDLELSAVRVVPEGPPGHYRADADIALSPGMAAPALPVFVNLTVDGLGPFTASIDPFGVPPAHCCDYSSVCQDAPTWSKYCLGVCTSSLGNGSRTCTYLRTVTFAGLVLAPNAAVTATIDPDGIYAETCSPGTTNNSASTSVPAPPVAYCTGKTNSAGCAPVVAPIGNPSATSPAPFLVNAHLVLPGKNGVLFYGHQQAALPFIGGTLCVQPPVRRTGLQTSLGNPANNDCSGAFVFDFNQRIQSGIDPSLAPGAHVAAQYWYRDAGDPQGFGTGLSNALWFQIGN